VQLRNIGRAKCIVCRTNPKVGRATALPAHYFPVPLVESVFFSVWIYKHILCVHDVFVFLPQSYVIDCFSFACYSGRFFFCSFNTWRVLVLRWQYFRRIIFVFQFSDTCTVAAVVAPLCVYRSVFWDSVSSLRILLGRIRTRLQRYDRWQNMSKSGVAQDWDAKGIYAKWVWGSPLPSWLGFWEHHPQGRLSPSNSLPLSFPCLPYCPLPFLTGL